MAATCGNGYCEADTVHTAQIEPRICGVQLGILSPEEIEALTVRIQNGGTEVVDAKAGAVRDSDAIGMLILYSIICNFQFGFCNL